MFIMYHIRPHRILQLLLLISMPSQPHEHYLWWFFILYFNPQPKINCVLGQHYNFKSLTSLRNEILHSPFPFIVFKVFDLSFQFFLLVYFLHLSLLINHDGAVKLQVLVWRHSEAFGTFIMFAFTPQLFLFFLDLSNFVIIGVGSVRNALEFRGTKALGSIRVSISLLNLILYVFLFAIF